MGLVGTINPKIPRLGQSTKYSLRFLKSFVGHYNEFFLLAVHVISYS